MILAKLLHCSILKDLPVPDDGKLPESCVFSFA